MSVYVLSRILKISLLAFIALSAAQSSAQTRIHSAILSLTPPTHTADTEFSVTYSGYLFLK